VKERGSKEGKKERSLLLFFEESITNNYWKKSLNSLSLG
jgi:hypothetical protein